MHLLDQFDELKSVYSSAYLIKESLDKDDNCMATMLETMVLRPLAKLIATQKRDNIAHDQLLRRDDQLREENAAKCRKITELYQLAPQDPSGGNEES